MAPFTPFLAEAIYQNLVRSVAPDAPASIHLTDFPTADPTRIDETLSRDMDAVLEIVGAGHAARQEAAIKVRQPLPALLVHSRDPQMLESVLRLGDHVLDELNVKAVKPLQNPEQFVSYTVRPNLRVLGPRLGKRLTAVREGLASLEPAQVAASVEAGDPVIVETSDGAERLEPGDILVDLQKLPGFATAQGPRSTVVLDTSLTPELIQEGWARDFVRGIQDARKRAGYRIEDTIEIAFAADPEVVAAITAHQGYVTAETLATSLDGEAATGASDAVEPESVEGPGGLAFPDGWYADQIAVGDHHVRIMLSPTRVAPM